MSEALDIAYRSTDYSEALYISWEGFQLFWGRISPLSQEKSSEKTLIVEDAPIKIGLIWYRKKKVWNVEKFLNTLEYQELGMRLLPRIRILAYPQNISNSQ